MMTHAENAICYLEAAKEARRLLNAEYSRRTTPCEECPTCRGGGNCPHLRRQRVIGELASSISFALSAAKVEAQLAISETLIWEIGQLREALAPSPAIRVMGE